MRARFRHPNPHPVTDDDVTGTRDAWLQVESRLPVLQFEGLNGQPWGMVRPGFDMVSAPLEAGDSDLVHAPSARPSAIIHGMQRIAEP
jgi:hypothetical protein